MPPRPAKADWHHFTEAVLSKSPVSSSLRSQHKSFNDIFRSSRLATIPKPLTSDPPTFYARHQQPHPQHQVLSSFNAAHQRGDWGLKRPLPPVKDAHIIVSEIDSQERQTPFTFATEKPRFIRRMREFGLVLKLPRSDAASAQGSQYWLAERRNRRPRSILEHFHPQWNRLSGIESGPWITGLSRNQFTKYLNDIASKRSEIAALRAKHGLTDDNERAKHLVQAYLDIPINQPQYVTHATAGLSYSAGGSMPSTPVGVKADPATMAGGLRAGRIINGKSSGTIFNALTHGVVANVENSFSSHADRAVPAGLIPSFASISRQGRLELSVTRQQRFSKRPNAFRSKN